MPQNNYCALLTQIWSKLKQISGSAKQKIDSSIACKNFTIALLFMMTILGLIVISICSYQITRIDSETNIEKQNELQNMKPIPFVYANYSCNNDSEVSYEIAATKEGCKCSEQLYPSKCTKSQQEQQNCIKIDASNSYTINLFPFQQNDDFNFAQKICFKTSEISMYDYIQQQNNCSNEQIQCIEKDYNNNSDVNQNQKCPISNFYIQNKAMIKQKQKLKPNRICNIQTNNQEPLIGIIVTNGFCQSKTNTGQARLFGSNFTLNTQKDDCQFEQHMFQIANYSVKQILEVNKIQQYYNTTRQFDDLGDQKYVIYGLRYFIPPQCRSNNKISDQQDNILNYEKAIRDMSIIVLTVSYLTNLFIIYAILQKKHIPTYICSIFNGSVILLILSQLLLIIIYKYSLEKECMNFELATINYAYPITYIIVLIKQWIIIMLLDPNIRVQPEQEVEVPIQLNQGFIYDDPNQQNQQGEGDIQNDQRDPDQNNQNADNNNNQQVSTQQIKDVAPQENQITEIELEQIKEQQIQSPQNQGNQDFQNYAFENSEENVQQIKSGIDFQSVSSEDSLTQEDLSPNLKRKTKIYKLDKTFKYAKQSQSSKKLIIKKYTKRAQD